jgi:hypothetical protein
MGPHALAATLQHRLSEVDSHRTVVT